MVGNEDLDALDFDDGGELPFSTLGSYSGAGAPGSDEDVSRFSGTFGSATSSTGSPCGPDPGPWPGFFRCSGAEEPGSGPYNLVHPATPHG